ncbi:dihydroorotase [Methanocella sp. CWC-04]|uniref:Dihydroorotase n=1 Tax=Methanooceanicella nereidis TaxID=2052831 RepID=A0AAP2RCR6_9EURY|nr:dihydroorotase [Methanocella sp. CWC-04]MCD1294486.1 dihydroorotase [Methanocella sp. CWC-04]
MYGLVVENAKVCFDDNIVTCSIGIDGGKIRKIAKIIKGEETYDARGLLALPGAIDTHVHFRDMEQEEKETWVTGSRSALYGGVTTVIDMPNTSPPTFDRDSFDMKLAIAKNSSMIDFGINAGVSTDLDELPRLWKKGAMAFGEIFMAKSTGGFNVDEDTLRDALRMISKMGATASIHAEDEALHEELKKALKNDTSPSVHSQMRPVESEINAVMGAIRLVKETRVAMHLTHISTAKTIELIKGEGITCDVTPHHLLLHMKHWDKLGARAKMNPPIRHDREINALWEGVNDGSIDVLASDHAPHTKEEKDTDVRSAPSGVPGVETMMPLMLKAVYDRKLSLKRLIDMASENPARIFGIEGKGRIQEGYDADIMFVDMSAVKMITAADLHSKAGWTPFEGFEGIFPVAVMQRGNILLDGKEFYAKRGDGNFLRGKGYRPHSIKGMKKMLAGRSGK